MLDIVRPYATAGIALVGAGVIAAAPITPIHPPTVAANPAVSADVTLAAASIANVPMNTINAFLSMPGAIVAGMERFAAAMQSSGSWHESSPNNVWGWDPANPEMLKGWVDMFIPFTPLSTPLGEAMNWWAAANLPMHEGCAWECPDFFGMLNSMFRVPMWEFWDADGYTFGEVINPVDGVPTEWSGQTVKLDPWAPVKSVVDYFMADPVQVHFPTAYEVITAVANLASALQTTGHLPKWIAVREIETFLKLFVPKPDAPEAEPNQTFTLATTPAPSAAAPESPELDTAGPALAATPSVSVSHSDRLGLSELADRFDGTVLSPKAEAVAPALAVAQDLAQTPSATTTPTTPVDEQQAAATSQTATDATDAPAADADAQGKPVERKDARRHSERGPRNLSQQSNSAAAQDNTGDAAASQDSSGGKHRKTQPGKANASTSETGTGADQPTKPAAKNRASDGQGGGAHRAGRDAA